MTAALAGGAARARAIARMALALAALSPSVAVAAGTSADDARAETLFNAAKQLQEAGQTADACPMFAESKRLAPGVGVMLHLADCYERWGRPASAWSEFQEAEALARARRDDKRAALAHERAQSLEPKIHRLTVAVAAAGAHDDWRVSIDGVVLPPERWNVALAVDPGDHIVTVERPGRAARTLRAHLDATHLATVVQTDDEPGPIPAPAVVATPAAAPAAATATFSVSDRTAGGLAPPSAGTTTAPTESPIQSRGGPARLGAELTLLGLGVLGGGFGSFFLVRRSVLASHNCPCDPGLENEAVTAATISFASGGAALVSSLVLLLTDPGSSPRTGWVLVPAPLSGGAGALVRATF